MSLSDRLQLVAAKVLVGRPVADIGTDHARLPVDLVGRGRVPRAIACDVAAGPLERARQTLRASPDLAVELRAGDGLTVLDPGEVATCVLAGMGGALLRRLVDASPAVVQSLERLVLQPNTDWPATRAWIAAHGWSLVDERLVKDAGHHYVVLVVDPRAKATTRWSRDDLDLGPLLRRRRDPSWRAWLSDRIRRHERALARARGSLPPADPRLAALRDQLERLHVISREPA